MLGELGPGRGVQVRPACAVGMGEGPEVTRLDPDVLLDSREFALGLREEALAEHHMQLLPGVVLEPGAQLARVLPTRAIGPVVVGVAEGAGLAEEPLLLAAGALGLQGEGPREIHLGLMAPPDLVPVVRDGALDRVPQDDDEAGLWEHGVDRGRAARVEEVVGGRLPDASALGAHGEVSAVPVLPVVLVGGS